MNSMQSNVSNQGIRMSIRETLDQHPRVAIAMICGVLVISGVMVAMQLRGPAVPTASGLTYSVDDGKTWFTDQADRIPPFDHGGIPAVRAYVFQKATGSEPFVGYLSRYTADGAAAIAKAKALADKAPSGPNVVLPTVPLGDPRIQEVKKPGTGNHWVPRTSLAASQVVAPKASDGSDAVALDP